MFLNLKNGVISTSTSRLVDAVVTDVPDILANLESEQILSADLKGWIYECTQIACNDIEEFATNKSEFRKIFWEERDCMNDLADAGIFIDFIDNEAHRCELIQMQQVILNHACEGLAEDEE